MQLVDDNTDRRPASRQGRLRVLRDIMSATEPPLHKTALMMKMTEWELCSHTKYDYLRTLGVAS